MKAKRSGWKHRVETTSRRHLNRRILTGKRRASRLYRLAKARLVERELDDEERAA